MTRQEQRDPESMNLSDEPSSKVCGVRRRHRGRGQRSAGATKRPDRARRPPSPRRRAIRSGRRPDHLFLDDPTSSRSIRRSTTSPSQSRRSSALYRVVVGRRPAWNAQGRYLVWSDIPNNRQMRWLEDDGHVSVFRSPSNYSNGNSFDFRAASSPANISPAG